MGVEAISTMGLKRRFGVVTALAGVDLAVKPGEIYALLGANGAGKSTLVRILCTLLRPSEGRAEVGGYDVVSHADEVRARIGVVLQSGAVGDRETGREYLRFQGRLHGLRGPMIASRMARAVELVDIGDAMDRPIGDYSGGMKRRLELAGALLHEPEVLFLDEPTVGLDPVSRLASWSEIRRVNRALGTAILLTTQQLEEADELAQRIGVIHGGRLVAEGTPDQLRRSYGQDVIVVEVDGIITPQLVASLRALPGVGELDIHGQTVTIRSSDGAGCMAVVTTALHKLRIPLRTLALRQPTLDDVFLEITSTAGHVGGKKDQWPHPPMAGAAMA